jgi:hypothetical protein
MSILQGIAVFILIKYKSLGIGFKVQGVLEPIAWRYQGTDDGEGTCARQGTAHPQSRLFRTLPLHMQNLRHPGQFNHPDTPGQLIKQNVMGLLFDL